jgi:hypothetical protein
MPGRLAFYAGQLFRLKQIVNSKLMPAALAFFFAVPRRI